MLLIPEEAAAEAEAAAAGAAEEEGRRRSSSESSETDISDPPSCIRQHASAYVRVEGDKHLTLGILRMTTSPSVFVLLNQ
jgi:hypothetical protein